MATRSGTLDNIPGLSEELKEMYRNLKRLDSVQSNVSIGSDITEEIEESTSSLADDKSSINSVESKSEKQIHELNAMPNININCSKTVVSKYSFQKYEEIVESDTISSESSTSFPALTSIHKFSSEK